MTAAVESIEGEKEQERDLISQAKEIENQNLLGSGMSIGFEAEHISYSNYLNLKNTFPDINWSEMRNVIELIAAVKDMDEIESLKTAVEITDVVFDKIKLEKNNLRKCMIEIRSKVTGNY